MKFIHILKEIFVYLVACIIFIIYSIKVFLFGDND